MSWREVVLRVARVPSAPSPPPGSPPRIFRAARSFLVFRTVKWLAAQLTFIIFVIAVAVAAFAALKRSLPPGVLVVVQVLELLTLIAYVAQILVSWPVLVLDYEMRWYMVSDRAIRIREGITTVREKTIALANIQNIAIRQGPLQRLLGISDVEVKTAGGGGESAGSHGEKRLTEPMHIAWFRGVDNAEEIRDVLREGVRRQRDAGLGDPDEQHAAAPGNDLQAAVSMLLEEARKLRAAVG